MTATRPRKPKRRPLLITALCVPMLGGTGEAAEGDPAGFEGTVQPFLQKYCYECHGPEKEKGGFRADQLGLISTNLMAEAWQDAADAIGLGDMPPPDHDNHPTPEELAAMDNWMQAELARAKVTLTATDHEVVLRRLTPLEYDRTIRDLLKIDLREFQPSKLLPGELETDGFTSNGAASMMSPAHLGAYVDAAAGILDHVVTLGERPEFFDKRWTPTKQLLGGVMVDPAKPGTVYLEHWFTRAKLPREEFTAHFDGLYRVTVQAHGVPPAMHRPGPRRWPVEMSIRRIRPSEPKNPEDHIFIVEEESEAFVAEIFMKAGDRLEIVHFNGWELSKEHLNEWRERGWHHHLVLEEIAVQGPMLEDWPLPRHQAIFGELPTSVKEVSDEEAAVFLRNFAQRAFRRPVPDAELEPYFGLYRQARSEGHDFYSAMTLAAQGVLASPRFLYLTEPPGPLDDFAIANRLSYFLWSSMPDDQLFRRAAQGELRDPQVLVGEFRRMLDDPKADALYERFAAEWLNTDHVGVMTPDKRLYPEFDNALLGAMQEESSSFLREMVRQNLPLTNIVDSDWTMLNERLAEHYGIEGVEGDEMRRVSLPAEAKRGGIITHASVLNVTSNGTLTSPVVRGVWMMENILGDHPPAPPPDVPLIEPDIRGATTIREQLDKHREIPSCANCHRKFDPLGFAFESYDVLGAWRENYRVVNPEQKNKRDPSYIEGPEVDTADELPGLGAFGGVPELKQKLLQPEVYARIERAFVKNLLAFAVGRQLRFSDEEDVDRILTAYRSQDPGARTLIEKIVTSKTFLNP